MRRKNRFKKVEIPLSSRRESSKDELEENEKTETTENTIETTSGNYTDRTHKNISFQFQVKPSA